jgi:hypothetical protein
LVQLQTLAAGRIVLQLRPLATTIDSIPEIVLENGDKIVISSQVKAVSVGGAIYNQSADLYHPGMRVQDYVREAGNGTRSADLKHLIVVRADGSILGRRGTLPASGKRGLKGERVDYHFLQDFRRRIGLVKSLTTWTKIPS